MTALSDEAWAEICAAAARHDLPLVPDDGTRAVLSYFLFERYPAYAYDRAGWAATAERAERMLKHLSALEADYREQPDPVQAEAHLRGLRSLRSYVENMWGGAWAWRHANAGRKSEQRALLYYWLCTVWRENFHAEKLKYGRPHGGGEPHGALIDFILTAMRQVMPEDELPSLETVSDAIDRYRKEREKLLSEIRKRERGTHMVD